MGNKNRWGMNVLEIPDEKLFWEEMAHMQPGSMLFFQDQQEQARELKRKYPAAHVVIRGWPDQDNHIKFTPQEWVERVATDLGRGGLIVQTSNEAGWDANLLRWHEQLLEFLIANPEIQIKIGLLGSSVGVPKPEEWAMAKRLFELAAHPSLKGRVFLILHEYFAAVVTSGQIGGYPDNAGAQPGSAEVGRNLIPFNSWMSDLTGITQFHMGRYHFYLKWCEEWGLEPLPIIMGEVGADYLGDLATWLHALPRKNYNESVNGWLTLIEAWEKWYNANHLHVYQRMLEYADEVIYKNPHVVGLIVFAYGQRTWLNYLVNKPDHYFVPFLSDLNRYETGDWENGGEWIPDPPTPPVPPPEEPCETHSVWAHGKINAGGFVPLLSAPLHFESYDAITEAVRAAIVQSIIDILLPGEPVFVLVDAPSSDFTLVQRADGTVGFVPSGVVDIDI